jgi:excisionase family DNA binding protein
LTSIFQDMSNAVELMPTWRDLDTAAKEAGVSRRTISKWVKQGKLRLYARAGDRKHYVDMDELEKLREFKPLSPKD